MIKYFYATNSRKKRKQLAEIEIRQFSEQVSSVEISLREILSRHSLSKSSSRVLTASSSNSKLLNFCTFVKCLEDGKVYSTVENIEPYGIDLETLKGFYR